MVSVDWIISFISLVFVRKVLKETWTTSLSPLQSRTEPLAMAVSLSLPLALKTMSCQRKLQSMIASIHWLSCATSNCNVFSFGKRMKSQVFLQRIKLTAIEATTLSAWASFSSDWQHLLFIIIELKPVNLVVVIDTQGGVWRSSHHTSLVRSRIWSNTHCRLPSLTQTSLYFLSMTLQHIISDIRGRLFSPPPPHCADHRVTLTQMMFEHSMDGSADGDRVFFCFF